MSIEWKGVMPAVTTQFTANDTLDLELFKVNIDAHMRSKVSVSILTRM